MPRDERKLTIDEVARIPFFNDLSDEYLQILTEMLEIFHYEQGKFIFKEGEVQDSMFFITEGSVSILKNTEDGRQEELAVFNAPQVIGEMALISPGTRSATILTNTPASVVRFGCASFEKIIKTKPQLAINILRKAGDTVCTRLKNANRTYLKAIHECKVN
jgi:CRP-like cAMP-binding protein